MSQTTNQGTELLQSVEEEVKAETVRLLSRRGEMSQEERESIGESLGKFLAECRSRSRGGKMVYVPKDRKRRASMMYAEFDGGNHADVARKYGVCIQTAYRVIKQVKEERQGQLVWQGNLLDGL